MNEKQKSGQEKFYKAVKGIVLYPGSLDELNMLQEISGSGRMYELMPQKGGRRFITGIIIPTPSELEEQMTAGLEGIGGLLGGLLGEGNGSGTEEPQEAGKTLEDEEFSFFTPELAERDIRLKAKKIGAKGLVRFQLYTPNGFYMGVPVKLID